MASTANPINSTVGNSISGVANTLTVQNPSNTASSQSAIVTTVGGTSSDDTWIQHSVGSTRSYCIGIDNSASQVLTMTTAASATVTPSTANPAWTFTPATGFNYDLAGTTSLGIGVGVNPTSTAPLYVSKSQNATTSIRIDNASNGASASALLQMVSDTANATIGVPSSGFTFTVARNTLFLNSDTTGCIGIIYNAPVGGTHKFYANVATSVQVGQIDATGITSNAAVIATTSLQGATLAVSGSSLTPTVITSTDAGAAAGPVLDLYRNSASPAASDILGQLIYNGADSGAAKQEYARVEARIISTTAASEKGALAFYTMATGTATKQIDLLDTGGQYRGNNINTAPPASFIGEQIISKVARASAITVTSTVAIDVTSMTLTPGVWDVTILCQFLGTVTGTVFRAGISTTSATLGTEGDDYVENPIAPTAASDACLVVPPYRMLISTNTIVYFVVQDVHSVGTLKAFGRISGVRVG